MFDLLAVMKLCDRTVFWTNFGQKNIDLCTERC